MYWRPTNGHILRNDRQPELQWPTTHTHYSSAKVNVAFDICQTNYKGPPASTAIQFTLRQLSREEVLFSGLAVLLLLLHFLSIHRNTRRVQDSGYTREGCCNLFHSVVLCKEFRGCRGKHWRVVKDSPESGSAKNVLLSNISPFTASSLRGRKTG